MLINSLHQNSNFNDAVTIWLLFIHHLSMITCICFWVRWTSLFIYLQRIMGPSLLGAFWNIAFSIQAVRQLMFLHKFRIRCHDLDFNGSFNFLIQHSCVLVWTLILRACEIKWSELQQMWHCLNFQCTCAAIASQEKLT